MAFPGGVLVGSYDHFLVVLSVVIAILASYAALDFAGRITAARERRAGLLWLSGGAVAMGIGIWSMHYVGMLAFRLPIAVQYDWPTVLLSLLAAILASAVALFVVSREKMGLLRALLGSAMMGGGIATMHYVGMDAMRLSAMCTYSVPLVTLSVVLAVVISFVALWLTFHLRTDTSAWSSRRIVSALVMGAAIPVMHYTGMAAVSFMPSAAPQDLGHAVSVSSFSVIGIVIVTVIVLGLVPVTNLRLDSLSNTRRLMTRYFLFLGAISLLAILSTLAVQREGEQSRSDARVINIAGRQTMLSQAIAKDALLIAHGSDRVERQRLVADLGSIETLWAQSHRALKQGDLALGVPDTNSPKIREMFSPVEVQYAAMVGATGALLAKASTEAVLTGDSAEVISILDHEKPYLGAMNAIVDQYEREATARAENERRLYFGVLFSILGVLLLLGLVVLRPALTRIQRGITQLVLAKRGLQRKATFIKLLQVVTVAANEATSVEAALQFTIDKICKHTGWPIGHVYTRALKGSAELTPSTIWYFDNAARFQAFCEITQQTHFGVGLGLPGRVLESGKPAWISDITLDPNFPRKYVAGDLGLKGAFAFPVCVHTEVAAVLEFFSSNAEEPDDELLAVMSNVGSQLSQVVERARAQQELARKVEELARSNAELEQFAYIASHDLQEPLRMVVSYTQLLARRYQGKLDGDADEFIGFAVDGATRMQNLIRDLLSYSRVTTKGQSLQLTDVKAACDSALANLQTSIQESNAVVSVGPLPTVLADATQLTQLFQNLIGNAVRYRHERAPEVHVEAKSSGDQWVVSVKDNGIGIEPQYFERIFQMFQRLHTRAEYPGTGIGLSICRKIVERHGGKIWLESQPGMGTTFLFTIPRT